MFLNKKKICQISKKKLYNFKNVKLTSSFEDKLVWGIWESGIKSGKVSPQEGLASTCFASLVLINFGILKISEAETKEP